MLKILAVIDDDKFYEQVRKLRWPEGTNCPHCGSHKTAKDGHDEAQKAKQRYKCKQCCK